MRRHLIGSRCASLARLSPVAAPAQQAEDIVFAYPNVALTFSAAYLGEDRGFFAKHGLKVKGLVIAGPGATNAVISGSADFALASTVVQTRAAAKGQRLLSIANPLDRPVVQIILRKDLVPNFDPKAPLNDRIRRCKGRTIAVDAIGSILHGFPLMLAKRAGLDPRPTSASRRWRRRPRWRRSRPSRSTASRCRCRGRSGRCSTARRS